MRRNSKYRQMVQDCVKDAPGPVSADEVHAELSHTGVGIATVYRLLNEGVDDGRFINVELPNSPMRFEPANLGHHHHFECNSCNKVYDVHGCPPGLDRLVPQGFIVEHHEVILFGQCRNCSDSKAA